VEFEPTTPAMSKCILFENNRSIHHSSTFNITANHTYSNSDEFWIGFERFLSQTNNHRSANYRLNYVGRYVHIIQKDDARELFELKKDKRIHVMKSLSALSKYTGCYDK
jgi:hypothetical protein